MKRVFILAGANGSGKSTVDLTLVAHGNGNVVVLSQERFDAFKEDVCLK